MIKGKQITNAQINTIILNYFPMKTLSFNNSNEVPYYNIHIYLFIVYKSFSELKKKFVFFKQSVKNIYLFIFLYSWI